MPDVKSIVATLKKASSAYYNGDKAIMSDSDFDKLRDHLKKIDPDNEFFDVVGAPVPAHREEVKLLMHMGSQNKAKDEDDMKTWFNKYNQPFVIISDKLDGSSMEAVYENGELVRVATRGDGTTGMNVTKNAKLWEGLPHNISVKKQIIVRGEAQLSVANWQKHYSTTANPRNTGNGIAVCDTDYERNKHLSFHAFDIVHPDITFKKQQHKYIALKKLGFGHVRYFLCKDLETILKCRSHYEKDRPELEFEIDGMIIAIDDLVEQEKLGYSDGGSRPRGQIAWKFETDKAETEVLSINLTIGHTGKIIPTATLKAVKLAGTTVTHCLLNNFDYIEEKDINVGDIVQIEKGGDIIPWIEKVIKKNTKGCFQPPKDWKGYQLVKEGRDWKVIDEDCPDLNFQRIKNWISKLNIKQLGDSALLAMVEDGMVKDIDDLYSLDEKKLAALPTGKGVIGSNAKKILAELNKTREITIDLFIGSLSIKTLGRSRAALLELDTIKEYLDLTPSELVGKKCSDTGTYGDDSAKEVCNSLQNRRDIIEKLSKIITVKPLKKSVTGKLSGLSFCFSGVRMTGEQKDDFEALGGTEKSGVNADLTYLVLKDVTSTSSKAEKAAKLGVKIISMDDFDKMLK